MAGPTLKRISGEDYPEAPDWFHQFLDTINPFLGATSNTLSGNLTSANFKRQIETFHIDTQSNVSATFSSGAIQVKNKLGVKPVEVRIGQIYPRTSGATLVGDQWHAPSAFTNSWANFGGSEQTAQYMKDASGFVHLRGMIKSGTITASAFTLPSGYVPAANENFVVVSNGAMGYVSINNVGAVTPNAGSNVWVSLAGITFQADTSTSSATVAWELLQSGLIKINYIDGLAPSQSYDVTLIIE